MANEDELFENIDDTYDDEPPRGPEPIEPPEIVHLAEIEIVILADYNRDGRRSEPYEMIGLFIVPTDSNGNVVKQAVLSAQRFLLHFVAEESSDAFHNLITDGKGNWNFIGNQNSSSNYHDTLRSEVLMGYGVLSLFSAQDQGWDAICASNTSPGAIDLWGTYDFQPMYIQSGFRRTKTSGKSYKRDISHHFTDDDITKRIMRYKSKQFRVKR